MRITNDINRLMVVILFFNRTIFAGARCPGHPTITLSNSCSGCGASGSGSFQVLDQLLGFRGLGFGGSQTLAFWWLKARPWQLSWLVDELDGLRVKLTNLSVRRLGLSS